MLSMQDYSNEYEQNRIRADELDKEMRQKMADMEARVKEYKQQIADIEQQIKDRKREERKQEIMIAVATEATLDKAQRLRAAGDFLSEEVDLKHKKRDLEKELSKYEFDKSFEFKEMDKQIKILRS